MSVSTYLPLFHRPDTSDGRKSRKTLVRQQHKAPTLITQYQTPKTKTTLVHTKHLFVHWYVLMLNFNFFLVHLQLTLNVLLLEG